MFNDSFGYGSIPFNTYRYIFSGMNIHLPAILGFTRYQGFDPSPFDVSRSSRTSQQNCDKPLLEAEGRSLTPQRSRQATQVAHRKGGQNEDPTIAV